MSVTKENFCIAGACIGTAGLGTELVEFPAVIGTAGLPIDTNMSEWMA